MSNRFPNHIIFEILLQLQIKAIIRFKGVSKTWCFLISSRHFIANHLSRSLCNPQRPPYLLFHHFKHKSNEVSLTLHLSKDCFSLNNFKALRKLHQNIKKFKIIVGSSNGLLCLAGDFMGPECGLYVLWNPSIQKAIALPEPDVGIKACHLLTTLGFGYAPKTDDYKLVRIVYPNRIDGVSWDQIPHWVQIYTLRTRAWRNIMVPGPPYHIMIRVSAAFLHGAVHWKAYVPLHGGARHNVIVSFDMEDEEFHELGMPKCLKKVKYLGIEVVIIGGLLAIVYDRLSWGSKWIWVMKEYGVVESWTLLFDINDMNFVDLWGVGIPSDDGVIMRTAIKLFSNVPRGQRTVHLPLRRRFESFFLGNFVESLVLSNVEDRVLVRPTWLARFGAILKIC